MSQVAAMHPTVEPAESPLTPESWGKLGMWVFLIGDAVGFGVLLAGYGAALQRARTGPPLRRAGYQPDGGHDVPAHLLERDHGEGPRVARQRRPPAVPDASCSSPPSAAPSSSSCQAYEWSHLIHRGLHIDGNPWGASLFGTTFFLITGFHGLHVTAGVIYLLAMVRVVARRPDPAASYNAVEITGLYWHFVDLVWIMVFTLMYLL